MKSSLKRITASLLALSVFMSGYTSAGNMTSEKVTASTAYDEDISTLEFSDYILEYEINKNGVRITGCRQTVDAESIDKITVPEIIDGVTVTDIGNSAFYYMNYDKLELPDTINNIGEYALGNWGIKSSEIIFSLPESLLYLGEGNLSGKKIKCLNIPAGLELISRKAFENTVILDINVEGDGITSFSDGCLVCDDKLFYYIQNDDRQKSVTIPDGITEIMPYVFRYSSISEFIFPDSLQQIDEFAFTESEIQALTLPEGFLNLGFYAFSGCTSLKNVKFPSTMNLIERYAFEGCSNITDIDFGTGALYISDHVFSNALNTEKILLPDSVRYISPDALSGSNAGAVEVDPDNKDYSSMDGILFNKDLTELICCAGNNNISSYTVPDTVKKISSGAFEGNKDISEIILPDSVEEIGSYAFYQCENLKNIRFSEKIKKIEYCTFAHCSSLTAVDLPPELEYIGSLAFFEAGLRSLTVPESVKIIESRAFNDCSYLKEVVVSVKSDFTDNNGFDPDVIFTYASSDDYAVLDGVLYSKDKTVLLLVMDKKEGVFTVPDTVREIADSAFKNQKISKVILPEGLEKIGKEAFFECMELAHVTVPESVTSVGERAFYNCRTLNDVIFNGKTTELGMEVFENCYSFYKICLPDKIRKIPAGTFRECVSVYTARIPDGTEVIETEAMPCTLREVYIPASVKKIASDAFNVNNLNCICGEPGSYAETFAAANNVLFVAGSQKISGSDVNADGRTDIVDLIMLKSVLINDDTVSLKNADINGDKTVNAVDLAALQKVLLGMDMSHPYKDIVYEKAECPKLNKDAVFNAYEFYNKFITDKEELNKFINGVFSGEDENTEVLYKKYSSLLDDYVIYMYPAIDMKKCENKIKPSLYQITDDTFTMEIEYYTFYGTDQYWFYTVLLPRELYKGQFVDNNIRYNLPQADKPVIYLYPEEETKINVKLSLDDTAKLSYSYPKYPDNTGWTVTAEPDSTLYDENGRQYSYLFWEARTARDWDMSSGFVIKGEDTVEFLQDKLEYLGLTPKEYNDFIVYWLPKMQDNKYNLITFQTDDYEEMAKLEITPEPDSVQRVFMTFKAIDEYIEVPEQTLVPFERYGFSVIEWGGSEIR